MLALALVSLAFGPPVLPPEPGDTPTEIPEEPSPPADEASPPADEASPPVAEPEDEAIPITPESPAEVEPAPAPTEPSSEAPVGPTVQRPTSPTPQTPTPQAPTTASTTEAKPAPAPMVTPAAAPATEPAATPEKVEPQPDPEAKKKDEYRKLGGFRLARLGVAAKLGYTSGTSQKNGLFDRNKSIQDSINNMDPTVSGGGDLGNTKFGGFQGGFILDAEVVGINVWLDFHKFFNPGGMWSLLLGYDHEFGFGKRLRLDVGAGIGVQNVFLGQALKNLYYDKDNPQAVNIATLGIEGRATADLHIKIVGPLFTGPYAMLGYHYLWSANAAEVTSERGLHFSLGWTLRVDLAVPKLIGGKKKSK